MWSYEELKHVKDKYEKELMRRQDVIGVGVGKDAVIVLVEGVAAKETIPEEIEGVPISTIVIGKFELY